MRTGRPLRPFRKSRAASLGGSRSLRPRFLLAAAAGLLLAGGFLAGCARPYVRQYERGVSANFRNLQSLRLGMTVQEVEQLMGNSHIVDYRRVQLRNPWRTESFRLEDGVEVLILHYVTQGYVWQGYDDRHSLTPVVFEDGRLTGWGWGYVERSRGRFAERDGRTAPKASAGPPPAR